MVMRNADEKSEAEANLQNSPPCMPLPPERPIRSKLAPRVTPPLKGAPPGGKAGATPAAKAKSKPPEQTFEEPKYLRRLIEHETPVRIKLSNNEEVSGSIEFYDVNFIRITREDGPNLFVFKHDIKYLYEIPK
jgi:sRNA-binding regulator protein Hfq